jgi:hypothetical protein
MLEKQRSVAFCYYCRKKIRMEEAVIRDNIVMCQKCAESHLATENAKKK